MICEHCNSEIKPGSIFCRFCGAIAPVMPAAGDVAATYVPTTYVAAGDVAAAYVAAGDVAARKTPEIQLDNKLKVKLSLYLIISALGFSYLVIPQSAGISVPLFAVVQFICMWFLSPKKKPLLMFIPIMILALNSFISANTIWRVPNLFVAVAIFSVMTLMMTGSFRIKTGSASFLTGIFVNAAEPFKHVTTPVKWGIRANKDNTKTVLRILTGVGITIPCLAIVLALLSSADAIFSNSVSEFISGIVRVFSYNVLTKCLCGIIAGFYLFGLMYAVRIRKIEDTPGPQVKTRSGDLLIINIMLVSILAVYTIFVLIQFKYLFASSDNLPYGLTYTYYARRGFFELLGLTGLNIITILVTTRLTKERTGGWAVFTKTLSSYLCAVTVVLLISSFYRMWLYNVDDGLTRLRFLVFGFLIFEAVGLLFTFAYIVRPKFNIIAVYACIALVYYLALNLVPMDRIIAKDQIDRYFETGRGGVSYVATLSADAAPEVTRLLESGDDSVQLDAARYFHRIYYEINDGTPMRWQRWNLSVAQFKNSTAELWRK